MSAIISTIDRRTKIGALLLDVLTREEIDLPSEVTQYPVEDGTTASDHIYLKPETLRVTGLIALQDVTGGFSNLATFGFVEVQQNEMKFIDVVEALRTMHKERALVEINTGQILYKDFAFSGMNAVRSSDGDGGNWLQLTVELTKITKVKLKSADVPPPENVSGDASGRAGETNKPAGKTTPSGNNNANTQPTQPENPNGRSIIKSGQRAVGDERIQAARTATRSFFGLGP
jgi:hypothetical protein